MEFDLPRIAERRRDAHKGDFGRVVVVGGSRGMAGSIALTAMAALKSGAGLVTAAIPDRCLEMVAAYDPCLMTYALKDDGLGIMAVGAAKQLETWFARCDVMACGPGIGTADGSVEIVKRILDAQDTRRVFDADALNVLSAMRGWEARCGGPLVLTPHPGELQRLTGVSSRDRKAQIAAAQSLSERTGCVMVVKGAPTVVVQGEHLWSSSTGNPGMATGGSGDVLTGITATLLGQKWSPWDAARLAVHIHGMAGDLAASLHGEIGMTALEILLAVPQAFRNYLTSCGRI